MIGYFEPNDGRPRVILKIKGTQKEKQIIVLLDFKNKVVALKKEGDLR